MKAIRCHNQLWLLEVSQSLAEQLDLFGPQSVTLKLRKERERSLMMSSQRSSVILRLRQRNLTLVTMFSIPMKLVQILLSYLKTMDQSHLMVLLLFEILQWASGFTLNSVYRNGKLPRKTKVFGRPKDGNGDSTGMQRVHSRQIPSSTL